MIPILILLLFNVFLGCILFRAFVFRYRGMLTQCLCAVIWLFVHYEATVGIEHPLLGKIIRTIFGFYTETWREVWHYRKPFPDLHGRRCLEPL